MTAARGAPSTAHQLAHHRVRRTWRLAIGREGSVRRPVGFLLLGVIIATVVSPTFIKPGNLNEVLINSSFLVVLAVGEAYVIMAGSIDLGPESLLAAFGLLAAFLTVQHGVPTVPALIATFVGAAVVGLCVGLLVAKVHIPSFVVTLASYWGFKGVALLVNGGEYIAPSPGKPLGFASISGSTGGISNLILIALAVVVVAQVVLTFTPYGTWLRSVGSNELAARRVGVHADAVKVSVFMVSAVLATLGGLMITAYQGSIYPLSGAGFSLEAIAAVILGGIPFTGGRGTVVGVALGALMIGIINDLIVLIGLPSLWEYVFVAVILIVAGLQARGGFLVK
jgi:ribose/xylose/arabinose/galactoside ABC-type transport system permease subunit